MDIPIEDHKWYRVDPWPGVTIPEGHHLEVTQPGDGTVVARISGPHAHVFGEGPDFDKAIDAAVKWLEQVGEL